MIKAIYARQSVDREDSISVESQIEFCKYELRSAPCREYIDRGYSGKDTNRPAFRQLLEDIRQGEIEAVIVYKLDRISRSILDFSTMMALFQAYGVEFVSSTEKFDTSSPIGRAMLNICIVFAQLERETIQRRVADAYYSRSKKGLYMGGRVPYGFQIVPTVIDDVKTSCYAPIPEEAAQVRLMYRIYARPEASLADILHCFNDLGYLHLRGKSWNTARLSELLRNPVYVRADSAVYDFFREQGAQIVNSAADFIGVNGCYLYKGEAAGRKQWDLRERHLVLAPHEGIVSSEQWLACRQKSISNRQSALPRKPKNSWLAGKTKCRRCGYALTVRRNKQGRRYFVCSGGGSYSTARCTGPGTQHADRMEALIADAIAEKLGEFECLSPPSCAPASAKIGDVKARLAVIGDEIAALVDKVPAADSALMTYINQRVSALEQERARLSAEMLRLSGANEKAALPVILDHAERWKHLDFVGKQLVADALIRKIYIDEDAVDILWAI
ncbi:recombinase family protein [Ruminococcaceae bacterium OttesenSCG-928-L11]|nr:recombinase family protein [Ruminococcaceae bacterium OttesenSCG-928-L11]